MAFHCLQRQRTARPQRGSQRGQSIAEFPVGLAVLAPLFFAIAYAGKYGDLQQTTTQASRYAALGRAMEPSQARLANSTIEDQMRTRFFLAGDYLHNGRIQSDDTVGGVTTDKGQAELWQDLSGNPLLARPDTITLQWGDTGLGSGGVDKAMGVMTKSAGKNYPGGQVARVEVTLTNKLDQINPSPKPIVIAAATAAAGNGLGSSGSKGTRDAAATIVPTSHIPGALTGFLEKAMGLFEPEGPKIGCIKPDVVATHRLDGAADNSQCK
jgi:hypothetical protein